MSAYQDGLNHENLTTCLKWIGLKCWRINESFLFFIQTNLVLSSSQIPQNLSSSYHLSNGYPIFFMQLIVI